MLYTKTKGIKPRFAAYLPPTRLVVRANTVDYSATANTLAITVPGDNVLKRVCIILLRQAEPLVPQLYQSLDEKKHIETTKKA